MRAGDHKEGVPPNHSEELKEVQEVDLLHPDGEVGEGQKGEDIKVGPVLSSSDEAVISWSAVFALMIGCCWVAEESSSSPTHAAIFSADRNRKQKHLPAAQNRK